MANVLAINPDQSERVVYSAAGLPVRAVSSRLSLFSGYAAACHWHDDLEFLIVREGGISYFVHGDHVRVGKGQGIFINAGRLHYGYSDTRSECEFDVLMFPTAFLGDAVLSVARETRRMTAATARNWLLLDPADADDRAALRLIGGIADTVRTLTAGGALRVLADCAALTASLYARVAAGEAQDPDWETLRRMTGFVQANFAGAVRLSDIAASGAVCRSKCFSLFRDKLGQTPNTYLTRYRLERARAMLAQPDASVTATALSCGFQSGSYLAEVFRREYGISPRAFRKAARARG